MKKFLFIILLSSSSAAFANAEIPGSAQLNPAPITDSKPLDLKGLDIKSFDIEAPSKDAKEWRSSTIHKVMDLCIKLGTSTEKCACTTDFARSKYSESAYLKLRAQLIDIVVNKKDIKNASSELKHLLDSTYKACSNS